MHPSSKHPLSSLTPNFFFLAQIIFPCVNTLWRDYSGHNFRVSSVVINTYKSNYPRPCSLDTVKVFAAHSMKLTLVTMDDVSGFDAASAYYQHMFSEAAVLCHNHRGCQLYIKHHKKPHAKGDVCMTPNEYSS